MNNSTFQRIISTVCTVLMVMTLHNLDLTDTANSILRQESQNVALDSTTFNSNQSEFKNCSTNSDCAVDQGQACVSGICLCNRFGWIQEPNHGYDRCNHITCTLQQDCRSHFGQGAYCNETTHFCSCATEMNPITQQCASPYMQINAKCAQNFTCKRTFGTASYCRRNTVCVCYNHFRFSPTERKCVPMEENVYLDDWPTKDIVEQYLDAAMNALLFIYGACVFVILCILELDSWKSSGQPPRNAQEQKTLIGPIQTFALAALQKNPQKPPFEFAVSLPSISESLLYETKANQSVNEPPPNYFEAVFGSTKVELMNLEQKQPRQKDENYCNHQDFPPEYPPPLCDSLADCIENKL